MKILFIAPLPPPISGHSLAAKILLDSITRTCKVETVNLSKESFVHGINSFQRIVDVWRILKSVWDKKKRADVIYFTISESFAGNLKDLFIYLICFSKLHNMVIHLHGGSIKKLLFDKYPILLKVNKYFIKRLGAAVILGDTHDVIFSEMLEQQKIYTVPNFAEDYLFLSDVRIREKFKFVDPLRVLFLSNLIEGKGYNYLIQAYKNLHEELKNRIQIDFAGSFESDFQKSQFLKDIEGLPRVKFHGSVLGDEKKQLLAESHVFCLPTSLNEGQPISILEAYASGCVVITTSKGGIPDIFKNKVNGYEIEVQSSASITGVFQDIVGKIDELLRIAIDNNEIANQKYRPAIYNAALLDIITIVKNNPTQ